MSAGALIIFIFFLVGIAAVLLTVVFFASNDFQKKVAALGGKVRFSGWGTFPFNGREISAKYTPPSRNTPPRFKIAITGMFAQDLVIRRETGRDSFAKKIGLNREVQLNDCAVDEELYFECDAPEFIKQILSAAAARPMVFEILDRFSSIHIYHNRCVFVNDDSPIMKNISREEISGYARKLIEFSAFIPAQSLTPHPELARFKFWRVVLYSAGYGTLAFGLISWIWAMVLYRVVDFVRLWSWSFAAMSVIVFGAGYFAFIRIKGFSTSSRVFGHFLVSLAIGILLLARYGTAAANACYDKSPPQAFEVKLLDKYFTKHKSSYSYYLVVAPWRPAQAPWKFKVGSGEFHQAICGQDTYCISTKAGSLGWEWVLSERRV